MNTLLRCKYFYDDFCNGDSIICPLLKMGKKPNRYVSCSGTLELDWIDYLKYKTIVVEVKEEPNDIPI